MQLVNLNNSYFLKQNDTATQIKLGVLDYEGNPFPLDTAEKIEVVIGVEEGRVLVKEASLLSGIGEIEFGLDEGDLLPVGDNRLEVHIYTSNGEKHVVPSKGYYKLRVQKPIDDLDVQVTTYTLDYFLDQVNKITEGLPETVKEAQRLTEQMQMDLDEVAQLKVDAQEAADLSHEARDVANQIIDDMTTVKADAEKATTDANLAATNATNAANNANVAADSANSAAERANNEADYAKLQGDYAKAQGDYAKSQAELIDDILEQGSVVAVNGKTGNVILTAEDVNAIPISEKGVIGGVARLNEEGKVVDANGNEVEGRVKTVNGISPDTNGNIEIETATSWNDLSDKPTSFPPSAHTHQISEVNGLQDALNEKASSEDLISLEQTVNEHLEDYAAFKSDVGNKNNLLTSDKTSLVSAINEVFTTGNNVKSNTVGALLSVDPNLPINVGSSWEDVINAIGQISTGKKWASGQAVISQDKLPFMYVGTGGSANLRYIEVYGLDFKASNIVVIANGNARGFSVYTELDDYYNYSPTVKTASYIDGAATSAVVYNFRGDDGNAYSILGGFRIPIRLLHDEAGVCSWIAYE